MKKQILDSPFLETYEYAFEDILEPNENIIWKGKPIANELFSIFDISVWGLIVIYIFFVLFTPFGFSGYIAMLVFYYLLYFVPKTYTTLKIRSLEYAITPKRILWTSNFNSNRQSFSIDLSNIKWVEIEDNAIFIRPKNYDLVNFETHSAKDLTIRKKPTLERIENMQEVYELIEKGIEGKL